MYKLIHHRASRPLACLAAAALIAAGLALCSSSAGTHVTAKAAPLPATNTSGTTAPPGASSSTKAVPATPPAAPPTAKPLPLLPPSTVAIPALHVTASVAPSCSVVDGTLEPPKDPREICEWGRGASLGSKIGTTLLAGHVDYAGVTGALGRIAELHEGQTIYTSDARRSVTRWRVQAVVARQKRKGILPDALAGPSGRRVLVLATCGGEWVGGSQGFAENVYVIGERA